MDWQHSIEHRYSINIGAQLPLTQGGGFPGNNTGAGKRAAGEFFNRHHLVT